MKRGRWEQKEVWLGQRMKKVNRRYLFSYFDGRWLWKTTRPRLPSSTLISNAYRCLKVVCFVPIAIGLSFSRSSETESKAFRNEFSLPAPRKVPFFCLIFPFQLWLLSFFFQSLCEMHDDDDDDDDAVERTRRGRNESKKSKTKTRRNVDGAGWWMAAAGHDARPAGRAANPGLSCPYRFCLSPGTMWPTEPTFIAI